MATLPLPPDLQTLLDRYRADRDAAIEAEAALLAARGALTVAERRHQEAATEEAAAAYGEAVMRAEAAERAAKWRAVALADALLADRPT